jgi:hypothetical protein
VTLGVFLQPLGLAVLLGWSFIVLSAVQLTIRLIRAYSVRHTAVAALVLTALALGASVVFDLALGSEPSFARRFELAPIAMLLMAGAGFAVARWVLKIKRLRGQVVAAIMIGLLDPHLYVLVAG